MPDMENLRIDWSLRAQRSNLSAKNQAPGDCFVTTFLAMTNDQEFLKNTRCACVENMVEVLGIS
jgi:hypothetical protein